MTIIWECPRMNSFVSTNEFRHRNGWHQRRTMPTNKFTHGLGNIDDKECLQINDMGRTVPTNTRTRGLDFYDRCGNVSACILQSWLFFLLRPYVFFKLIFSVTRKVFCLKKPSCLHIRLSWTWDIDFFLERFYTR